MPTRNNHGVQTRSKSTPSKNPSRGGTPPVTPASGTGRKGKKRTSTGKKSGRKKLARRLDETLDQDKDRSDDQDRVPSETAADCGETPNVRPERVPDEHYPPSVVDQL